MKRHSNTIYRLLAAATFVAALTVTTSCRRELDFTMPDLRPDERICFGSEGIDISVGTKASEVTSLSSFYVSAVTGSAGSEVSAWTSTQFNQVPASSPAVYSSDKYWPASNPEYKFYGSNLALNFAAGGTYVNASNATDVVCAYLSSPTYRTKNTLSFEHIFARLCRVDVAAQTGYTISNISMYITPKTGGTYNLRTGAGHTDGTGWSSIATGSATLISNKTGATNNDIYMVPGTYSITCTWTATDPSGASVTHTNEASTLPIKGGATNNISVVLGGDIVLGVDLQDYCEYDYRDNLDYLTFYCDETGTIGWRNSDGYMPMTIQYSKDFGATWTNLRSTTSGATVSVNAGDIVWFKGSNTCCGADVYSYNYFTLSNKAHVYGNVNSLIKSNTSVNTYCFYSLFKDCINLCTYDAKKIILPATTLAGNCYDSMFYGCTSLTSAPELPATTLAGNCYQNMFRNCTSLTSAPGLPATTLARNCYSAMFFGCTSLTSAPELLPATTLAEYCYSAMFRNCTSLTSAPELPATTLDYYCYNYMFYDCTSLTSAPELPATTLAPYCYNYMFQNCSSLTTAPELPATTLANSCYNCMFSGCTSLTSAPELPATTLANYCYAYMFYGCTSLNYIKALFTTDPSSGSYTGNWVSGVAATGTFVKSVDATWDVVGNNGVPTGWIVETGTYDAKDNLAYLTFYCDEAGTIGWKCSNASIARTIQYSKDFGASWTDLTSTTDGATVSVSAGDIVWFKGSNTEYANSYYNQFTLSNKTHVYGNVNSLTGNNTSVSERCFYRLFYNCSNLYTYEHKKIILPATTLANKCYQGMFQKCTSLTSAPELPATTLADECYIIMFANCTSLTSAPELPATTLAVECYNNMFANCTSLTSAPELPASTLADDCYFNMFKSCTSLTSAPELPATTLAERCYFEMFYGCTSLTSASELPATTLAPFCYREMFYGCTSLTSAPELPATTLANGCYQKMFYGCTSLNYIKALFTTDPSSGSFNTTDWVSDVAATGTFVKSAAATWNEIGDNGVPTGWTVKVETPGPGQWMDNPSNYLRFKFVTDGQVRWQNKNGDIQYSKNGGAWTAFNGTTVSMSAGDEIWFKGDLTGGVGASSESNSSKFITTGKFYASGNVQSLCSFDNTLLNYHFGNLFCNNVGLNIDISTPLSLPATTLAEGCYSGMFYKCASLTAAPELPATTLAIKCYQNMFRDCTSLTFAPELPATTLAANCYSGMFNGCTSLTSAPELPATTLAASCYNDMFGKCSLLMSAPELPATTLASNCYSEMFLGCASLTAAPELPATALADYCYNSMFYGCTSLTTAPELPATALANRCYYNMFYGCTSLTTAHALPATTLVTECYYGMFYGCTSLTTAPELPATTLAESCYYQMFYNCTSLTAAPELPATTLAPYCYREMFYGCASLNYIKALFTTTPGSSYTRNWVSGVASTGTFVKADAATWTTTGNHGVPTGWTVYKESAAPLPGEFSISSTKKMKFSKGNLQAVIGTGISDYRATASSWKLAGHQYDFIGDAAGNNSFAVGTTVDLFGWVGASASYDSYGLCTNTSANNAYYGTSDSYALKTEWGSVPGVVSALGSWWRTLTNEENQYLQYFRSDASSKWGHGSINGINGMIILPDVWALPANCSFSAGSSDWANAYTLDASGTTNAWVDMEAAGAVFLPAAGVRDGTSVDGVGSGGLYWTSSVCNVDSAYSVYFFSGLLDSQSALDRYMGFSVRLVKEAN